MRTQLPGKTLGPCCPLLITGVVLGGMLAACQPAHAVSFASFSDAGNTGSVAFANQPLPPHANPYSTASTTTVTNELVDFSFEGFPNLLPALLTTQSAHLSYAVSSSAAASASVIPSVGTFDSQPIDQTFTLSFTRTTPFTPVGHPTEHLSNLLTVTMTALPSQTATAEMSGFAGSSNVHLDADNSQEVVTFSSDFLSFAGTADHSMALSYTLQTQQYLGIGAKFLTAFDKSSGGTGAAPTCPATVTANSALCNYRGFKATELGNFGSTPTPLPIFTVPAPEPASMGVLGVGLLGLAAARRRRGV